LNKLVLQCWDGIPLNEEDRMKFRNFIRQKIGRELFRQVMNQFRTKQLFAMPSESSLSAIGELLKILFDNIDLTMEVDLILKCMVLTSTYYFPIKEGKTTKKISLNDTICEHKLFKDLDFWEKAVTQQIKEALKEEESEAASESKDEKIEKFNYAVYLKLQHFQYEMLSMGVPKDQIKSLMHKICKNCHCFPEGRIAELDAQLQAF